ncbi:hypothetical protein M569_10321 [Genlisea aurea]|uniref:Pentatricopeptide repeat-containing protein n=1 Tax=Genlisea aurea TaxID=192259 RepID=S8CBY3_9LAMI|nr:hypothetical protein M569_10321 [Genlisea aurea]
MMNCFCSSCLKRCRTVKCLQQFHAGIVKIGLDSDRFVAGMLMLTSAVELSGGMDYARLLFRRFSAPDAFMYNALIRGFADSDRPETSVSVYSDMLRAAAAVDSFSLAFALKAAANSMCLKSGLQLHGQALARGLDAHIFVGTTLVSMYGECDRLEYADKVFDEIPDPNVVTWNAKVTAHLRYGDVKGAEKAFNSIPFKNLTSYNLMLSGYSKLGEIGLARRLFDQMPSRDDVSWSTMISGLVQNGYFGVAFGCFRELLRVDMRPNEVTLTGLLSACAQSGALEFSETLHCFIQKFGLFWITTVNNALIDAYSKCGRVDMARLVFDTMVAKKNILSYTSLIVGLAVQGHAQEALKLFAEMESSGIQPDGVVFIALLYACSHSGFIEQGRDIFDRMTGVYDIRPEIEHYGCMVDLYGRTGQLWKAYEFISGMPIAPTPVIWRTLLGACSFHGDVNLAELVEKRLAEMDRSSSETAGDHVLMSNIYATEGKWDAVAAARKSMSKTPPAWSMVERK